MRWGFPDDAGGFGPLTRNRPDLDIFNGTVPMRGRLAEEGRSQEGDMRAVRYSVLETLKPREIMWRIDEPRRQSRGSHRPLVRNEAPAKNNLESQKRGSTRRPFGEPLPVG